MQSNTWMTFRSMLNSHLAKQIFYKNYIGILKTWSRILDSMKFILWFLLMFEAIYNSCRTN